MSGRPGKEGRQGKKAQERLEWRSTTESRDYSRINSLLAYVGTGVGFHEPLVWAVVSTGARSAGQEEGVEQILEEVGRARARARATSKMIVSMAVRDTLILIAIAVPLAREKPQLRSDLRPLSLNHRRNIRNNCQRRPGCTICARRVIRRFKLLSPRILHCMCVIQCCIFVDN